MNKKHKLFGIILLIILTFIGCGTAQAQNLDNDATPAPIDLANPNKLDNNSTANIKLNYSSENQLKVHFIDVGQGDSTLIEIDGQFMLIDAGENNQGDVVTAYLNKLGVEKINYLIATHPHSDHIGGLNTVINNFEIGTFIMLEIEHTTKTFEDVLDAAINNNLTLTAPVVGQSYILGDAEFIIIAPNDDYQDNLNNWSIGIKLIHGDNSFVFTGDAELIAEYDILDNEIDISATVYHAGHHGSDTSNSEGLLKAINPKYIVISCGEGNSYGHPHQEILDRINEYGITLYRTDTQGTIVANSDGISINWIYPTATPEPTPSPIPEPTEKISVTVYITKTGKKYHLSECSYLRQSKIAISLDDANANGYTPCSRCKP